MKYFLLVLSAFIVIASCKKVTNPTTRQETIRGGQWKVNNLTGFHIFSNKPTDTTIIVIDTANCIMDDYFTFGNNNDGTLYTGKRKCDFTEASEIPLYWDMYNNGNSMHIYNAGSFFSYNNYSLDSAINNAVNANIVSFSSSRIVLKYNIIASMQDPSSVIKTITDTANYTLTLTR